MTQITVTIDSKEYTVDIAKMPYFASHTSLNHSDPPHPAVALSCMEGGFHRAFDIFKTDLSCYPALCATLKRLDVNVLGSRSLAEVITAMKHFKFDDEKTRKANTNQASDSVFRLLYMHHTGLLQSSAHNMVFSAVIYVLSHRFFYGAYTRNAVRETYITSMHPSTKQLAAIGQWLVYDEDGNPLPPHASPDDDCYDNDDDGDGYDSETGIELCYLRSCRSDDEFSD